MPAIPRPTSGVGALDGLIDGVRVGDNLVVVIGDGVPDVWVVDRFASAADPTRLVVADTTGRHADARGSAQVLDWSAAGGRPTAEQARAELAEADRRVGADAAFAFDSLTAMARAWGDQAALDLFLWACPRLFRRGSVALWVVDHDRHDVSFLRRLTDVTQVVVTMRATDDGVQLEVVKADGRPPSVLGRAVRGRLARDDLVDVRPSGGGRQRFGQSLRQLRTSRGVNQAELARQVGISPSALSQAERGVRGVSAETLMRIWEALGVPFGIEPPASRGYRINHRGGHAPVALAGGVTGRQLSEGPVAHLWHLAVEARATGRGPLFAVKAAETVTVLRGVLQLHLEGSTETLHEGDTLVAETASITGWANPADTDAEVVWAIAR